MQNEVSNKIRLILNELAILNQPELIQGNYVYDVESLLRMKELAAELYLLSDLQVSGKQVGLPNLPVAEPEIVIPEPEVQPIIEPVQEIAEVKAPEQPVEIKEEIITTAPAVEIQPEPPVVRQEPPVEVPKPVVPEVQAEVRMGANLFDGKISVTRKFEYVNLLFAGNADDFQKFQMEISGAADRNAALEIFELNFEKRNWKRKEETAEDLKVLIKKIK